MHSKAQAKAPNRPGVLNPRPTAQLTPTYGIRAYEVTVGSESHITNQPIYSPTHSL